MLKLHVISVGMKRKKKKEKRRETEERWERDGGGGELGREGREVERWKRAFGA